MDIKSWNSPNHIQMSLKGCSSMLTWAYLYRIQIKCSYCKVVRVTDCLNFRHILAMISGLESISSCLITNLLSSKLSMKKLNIGTMKLTIFLLKQKLVQKILLLFTKKIRLKDYFIDKEITCTLGTASA